jgi:ribokinase
MTQSEPDGEASIVVIGSSNVDFIMGVEHLPAVGETVTDAVFQQTYGGKGANQAVAAARAGGRVTFVTGLGEDAYAPTILANFRRDGIRTEHILVQPGMASGSALVMFDRQGNNYLTVAPGANYALQPSHIDACAEVIGRAKRLVMQMELPVSTTLRALEIAAERGVPTLFNYAPVRGREIPLTAGIGVLVVNENEAAELAGLPVETVEQAVQAAEALRAHNIPVVIVTLGAGGAFVAAAEVCQHVPTFRVTPVDTTAAGDAFCGALAVALVEARPLLEAVRFANAAAALSVTCSGAQPSLPLRETIDAFLHKEMQ